ncbi:MAG: ABC transporter permease [Promethearchaeota archaeon]
MTPETEQIEEIGFKILSRKYFPPSFKDQIKEISAKFLKFLFIPGAKNKEIEDRTFELTKLESKRNVLKKLKSVLTFLGLFSVFIIITWAVFAPWISPFTFDELISPDFSGVETWGVPSDLHPLGTMDFGRDVYGRLIWGARSSLTIGLFAILISVTGGIFFGLISAFFGGWVDNVIMRITDIFLAFPSIILLMILVSLYVPKMEVIMGAYAILGIPGYARLMRGAALQEINKSYVFSARVSGSKNMQLVFKHILPNCIAPIIISLTGSIGGIVLGLAGLAFLGFGDPSLIEWGNDIARCRAKLIDAPWASLWPGFGILLAVLGFMLLGDGLRDALDPRLNA